MSQPPRRPKPGQHGPPDPRHNPRRNPKAAPHRNMSREAMGLGPKSRRTAFTLVELLVVIVIIGLLAGMALGGLNAARESARRIRTKAIIAKLDSIVMEKYESYLNRRMPISTSGLRADVAAAVQLMAKRDLMRMEMPERMADIRQNPIVGNDLPTDWPNAAIYSGINGVKARYGGGITRPSLSQAYLARIGASPNTDYESAECLYMIVTMGNPEARAMFSDTEIGDADGDGLLEFHDAWGNPIKFIRWAPAFTDSDIQSNNPESDHDPFDPYRLDLDTTSTPPRGARLVPLIYSAGPNGIYCIAQRPTAFDGNPYAKDADGKAAGQAQKKDDPNQSVTGPATVSSPDDLFDNIHNHRLEVK